MPQYLPRITLDQVRAELAVAAKPMIFYGAVTNWWTHNPQHLSVNDKGLPCDPRGGMLYESAKPLDFLAAAAQKPDHYGAHGLRAFEAAHHLNCVTEGPEQRPFCIASWPAYNALLDLHDGNLTPERTLEIATLLEPTRKNEAETTRIWTIYERPKDHPQKYVLRAQSIVGSFIVHDAACELADSPEEFRDRLRRENKVCMGREAKDEPQILESWM